VKGTYCSALTRRELFQSEAGQHDSKDFRAHVVTVKARLLH
jgi:hypothetical protein